MSYAFKTIYFADTILNYCQRESAQKPQTTVKNSENLIMLVLSRPFISKNNFRLKNGVE